MYADVVFMNGGDSSTVKLAQPIRNEEKKSL